jgi:hypothetical protein
MADEDAQVEHLAEKDGASARIRKHAPGMHKGEVNDASIGIDDIPDGKPQKNT